MDIFVCIGSSCHLKGSYHIISTLKEEVAAHHLEDKVTLNASFCLGQCENGVTMKIGDELVTGFTPENVKDKFREHVLKPLGM